jgi:hypothetical protein
MARTLPSHASIVFIVSASHETEIVYGLFRLTGEVFDLAAGLLKKQNVRR